MKNLYLTDIAKELNKNSNDVLSDLMSYDIIYVQVDNVDLLISANDSDEPLELSPPFFIDIKIGMDYLKKILRSGSWSGKTMRSNVIFGTQTIIPDVFEDAICPLLVKFEDSMSFSITDLFVYESDFIALKDKHPALMAPEETQPFVSALQPPSTMKAAPLSTGSRKDTRRIEATKHACAEITEELSQEKRIFDCDKDNWEPKLLFDTGRTTKDIFMEAVKNRLNEKPHRDTAWEAWKMVSADLKHRGRVRDQ